MKPVLAKTFGFHFRSWSLFLLLTLSSAALGKLPDDVFPVSQVKPGMKGYGLTVFKGTKIERFEVVVVGVLEQANFGRPLILIKMYGGPITQRGAMIIGGMSGSPIYLNGKIVGAVAYGFGFPKEPYGMVTPLEDMLEAFDPKLPPPSYLKDDRASAIGFDGKPRTVSLRRPLQIGGRVFKQLCFAPEAPQEMGEEVAWVRPLFTPVMVSGVSQRHLQRLRELLQPYGLQPVLAPGGAGKPVAVNFQPGAAVGGALATGDIDLTAIGTLTYRHGDRVLAFGHPFLGMGAIEMPMTAANVLDVFPSYSRSFKLANRAQVLGAIVQDRAFGIAGELGRNARMLPVTMQVRDETTGRAKTFRCEVLNHPLMLPDLIGTAAFEFVGRVHFGVEDTMAQVRFRIETNSIGTIERDNLVFDPVGIEGVAFNEVLQLVTQLQDNPFETVHLTGLKVEINVRSARRTATIDRIFVRESTYKPGDTVEVGVVIKPYKGEPQARTLQIRLPKNLPTGRYLLQAQGGAGQPRPSGLPPQLAMLFGGGPSEAPPVTNVQQIVKRFLERDRNNDLILRLQLNTTGVYVEGERLTQLPPVMLDVLRSPKSSNVRLEREEIKQVEPTEWVLSGVQVLTLNVQQEDRSERAQPQPQPSGETPTPPEGFPPGSPPPGISGSDLEWESRRMGEWENGSGKSEKITSNFKLQTANSKPQPPAQPDTKGAKPEAGEGKPAEAGKETAEKPVTRQVKRWQPAGFDSLSKGKMEGTTVTSNGRIQLTQKLRLLCRLPHAYVWSLVTDAGGRLYAGVGNGRIYQIQPGGEFKEFAKLPVLTVTALCRGEGDSLYAGGSPEGIIYRISANGQFEKVAETGSKYINALIWAENTLYTACGAPARLLAWQGGRSQVLLTSDEAHFSSLARDSKGNLYVGTSESGIVYQIGADGTQVVYDSAEPSATALATDSQNHLYIGTHPRGNVYCNTAEGRFAPLTEKGGLSARRLLISGDRLYIVTSNAVLCLPLEGRVEDLSKNLTRLSYEDTLDLLSATLNEDRLYVGTANAGEILVSEVASEGTYESPVHDAKGMADWGYLRWSADAPEGSTVLVQTRSGNTKEPDESWSAWSSPYSNPEGSRVVSPPARYIQFRLTLRQGSGNREGERENGRVGEESTRQLANSPTHQLPNSPVVRMVSLSYLPKNQPPKVTLKEPAPYVIWSGKKTVRWDASDPDGDTLSYETFLSSDNGATWQKLESKPVEAKPGEKTKQEEEKKPQVPSEREMMDKLQEELDKDPDLPPDLREQIMREAPQAIQEMRAEMEKMIAEGKPLPPEITETFGDGTGSKEAIPQGRSTSVPWDTTKFKDGVYLLKVVATDKPSMPVGFQQVEVISEPLIVCNTPPRVFVAQRSIKVDSNRRAEIQGFAFQYFSEQAIQGSGIRDSGLGKDENSKLETRNPKPETRNDAPVTAVQYRVKGGDWSSAEPLDGFFDSGSETFRILTDPLPAGEQTLEIKVFNAAGKTTTQEIKVQVPKGK